MDSLELCVHQRDTHQRRKCGCFLVNKSFQVTQQLAYLVCRRWYIYRIPRSGSSDPVLAGTYAARLLGGSSYAIEQDFVRLRRGMKASFNNGFVF